MQTRRHPKSAFSGFSTQHRTTKTRHAARTRSVHFLPASRLNRKLSAPRRRHLRRLARLRRNRSSGGGFFLLCLLICDARSVNQLRAIEKQLGGITKTTSERATARASTVGEQFAEAINPILSEVFDRFRRGQKLAADELASLGNEAARIGAQAGHDGLERIAAQTKNRPLVTLAIAIGVGVLMG